MAAPISYVEKMYELVNKTYDDLPYTQMDAMAMFQFQTSLDFVDTEAFRNLRSFLDEHQIGYHSPEVKECFSHVREGRASVNRGLEKLNQMSNEELRDSLRQICDDTFVPEVIPADMVMPEDKAKEAWEKIKQATGLQTSEPVRSPANEENNRMWDKVLEERGKEVEKARKEREKATAKNNKMWDKVLHRREKEIKQKGVTLTQEQYDILCQQARAGVTAEARVKELEGKVAGLEKNNSLLNSRVNQLASKNVELELGVKALQPYKRFVERQPGMQDAFKDFSKAISMPGHMVK